jgi:hypothetical protein
MTDIDFLVKEKFVALKNRATDALAEKHPQLFSLLNMYFSEKKYSVGLQITEDGRKLGDFTIFAEGVKVTQVQSGVLAPEVPHPFGIIKPYVIVEKDAFEKMLEDEHGFINEPFTMMQKYMPDITIKFIG